MRFLMIAFICFSNWTWGWIYVAVVVLGQAILVLPKALSLSPERNDCLLMPAGLLRKFVPYRGPEIGKEGRLAMVVGGAGSVVTILAFQGTAAASFVLGSASPFSGLFRAVPVQTLPPHRLPGQSCSPKCELRAVRNV